MKAEGSASTATPSVQYGYDYTSAGKGRLTSMTYPNGNILDYNYNTGVDSNIGRISSLSFNGQVVESYKYLGIATVVERDHPETGVNQSYLTGSITTNDGGDSVIGLDRFGRAIDQYWGTGTTTTDEFQYGYDKDNNRLYAVNVVNSNFGELYHYDSFNQIADFTRGTLANDNNR